MASHVIVALFDDYRDAQGAIGELETAGIRSDDINIVANNVGNRYGAHPEYRSGAGSPSSGTSESSGAEAGAAIGAVVAGGAGLLAALGALAIPGIGPVVAAGALVSTLAGAGVGAAAGGVLGALIGAGISREHADIYAEAVRRGGTLVTVRSDDTNRDRVSDILGRHSPADVDDRASSWRSSGWTGFDPKAETYSGPYYGIEATTTSGAAADHGVSAGRPPETTPLPTGSGALDSRSEWNATGGAAAGARPVTAADIRSRVRSYPI